MTTMSTRTLTATLEGAVWKKSSYSGSSQGQCVEIVDLTATLRNGVGVRDSKDLGGPALVFTSSAFASFITQV